MSHHTSYCVEIQDTDDVAATYVGSITNASHPIDSDIQQSNTAGTYYPENVSIAGVDPRSAFTTMDVEGMLDYAGVFGVNLFDDNPTKVGFAFYQALYNNGELGATGHRRLRMPRSYLMNRNLTAAHRVDASMDVEAWGLYDGTNNPMIPDNNATLPNLPANPGRWTLSPHTSIGGESLNCAVDVNIDFGINPTLFGCDSDEFNSQLSLDSIQPTITFTILDLTFWSETTGAKLRGLCGEHIDTALYLRKRTACGAGFEANDQNVHIDITAAGVMTIADGHNATGNSRGEMQLVLTCRYDGTNTPIVVLTGTQIPFP